MYLMCGCSGAGKTTYSKKFAKENNLKYLGIDDFYKSYPKAPAFLISDGVFPVCSLIIFLK